MLTKQTHGTYKKYEGFLTEEKLGFVLEQIYPYYTIEKQYKFKVNTSTYYVDFYIPEINTIVEFDGHFHYTIPSNCVRDIRMKHYCIEHSINLINIPYFIQLDSAMTKLLFNIDVSFTTYKHGFIDSKQFPSTFCTLGERLYTNFLDSLCVNNTGSVVIYIEESLLLAAIKHKSIMNIYPYSDINSIDFIHTIISRLQEKQVSIEIREMLMKDYVMSCGFIDIFDNTYEIYNTLISKEQGTVLPLIPLGLLAPDEIEAYIK